MKTHWISEANFAKHERAYTKATRWAAYAQRQANKQVRANARYDIAERLDEVTPNQTGDLK